MAFLHPLLRTSLLVVATLALVGSIGCSRKAEPVSGFAATGVVYVPVGVKEGHARFWGIKEAALEARRTLRNNLLNGEGGDLGLSEELRTLTVRSDFMRAVLDEQVRQAEICGRDYSREERRAEVTIAADPEKIRTALTKAAASRPADAL